MSKKQIRAEKRAAFFRTQAHQRWAEMKLEKARRKAAKREHFLLGDVCPQLAALAKHAFA